MTVIVRASRFLILLPFATVFSSHRDGVCQPFRGENASSFTCICTTHHCDTIQRDARCYADGHACIYTSDMQKLRFHKKLVPWHQSMDDAQSSPYTLTISANSSAKYQTLIGFGGAMTDAAGINIASLAPLLQKQLLKAYFSADGIEYNIIRVPIASCDFSAHVYSYDDTRDDFDLADFALNKADFKYKIPYIHQARALATSEIKVFGSPWGPPYWMKTTDRMEGNGTLIGKPGNKYYKTWAQYFVKFVKAYQALGVPIWGLTVENEPSMGLLPSYPFQALGLSGEMERDFVSYDLCPALKEAELGDLKLMIFDDNRKHLKDFVSQVLSDSTASSCVDGIAVHWYNDDKTNTSVVDDIHARFPRQFILSTEACRIAPPLLGSWERAELYAKDIIEDLNHHYSGWVDWNLALNKVGGPNWVANYVDSPVIVEPELGRFHKQPMFYAMGHFSKFIRPGGHRVKHSMSGATQDVHGTVWCHDDTNSCSLVLLNRGSEQHRVSLKIDEKEMPFDSPPRSIVTVLFPKQSLGCIFVPEGPSSRECC